MITGSDMQMDAMYIPGMCAHCGARKKYREHPYCRQCRNEHDRLARIGQKLPKIDKVEPRALNYISYDPVKMFLLVRKLRKGKLWIPWLYEHRPKIW